ncbi:MAG: hypothetical protein A4E71_00449 [Smithella sp. PtaU1.Bin162]|nr:MAG: hypothetical protein A4E71_00449 [Smithella sp. PtaU1.Bin162]
MRSARHIVRSYSHGNLDFAGSDRPQTHAQCRQRRAAGPIHCHRNALGRKTGNKRCLPGRNVLIKGRLRNNAGTVVDFFDFFGFYADSFDDFFHDDYGKFNAVDKFHSCVEFAEGRSHGAYYYYIFIVKNIFSHYI